MSHLRIFRKVSSGASIFQKYTFGKVLNGYEPARYSSASANHYDIVVAGGGMIGTALACTLGKNRKLSEKKILLLEAGKKVEPWVSKEQYDVRVFALSPSTISLFEQIGVWEHIAKGRYGIVKKMQVWDGISDVMITFNNSDLSETIAYIVENGVILAAIDEELKKLSNVTVINEAKVKGYVLPQSEKSQTKIEMENGNSYNCDLLVSSLKEALFRIRIFKS